jgi:1-acyl-sn-glycerol-3-phosphate acyltransferase
MCNAMNGPPRRSTLLCRWFAWWVPRYLRRHFHAVRLARGTRPRLQADWPLIVVLNHPSWWDPLIGVVLSGLFPEREHYAPMDAKALTRYTFFNKLGFYGVEQGTARGGLDFVHTTAAILRRPGATVWITAQGQIIDARVRPPRLRPGIGHVARRLERGVVVTLALEYPFWEERLPEALARFGEPIVIEPGQQRESAEWVQRIEASLEAAQDSLREDSLRRDPRAFETLVAGRAAIGGVYDWWRRGVAWIRGERFQPEHGFGGEHA